MRDEGDMIAGDCEPHRLTVRQLIFRVIGTLATIYILLTAMLVLIRG